ncbi:Alanyl-tRNA synthetase class IIc N-terminal [Trinorchestia longiramus]|nr:Alanyl-tRNA synthetase class IIc N-terminal [Trinorchestia longiramus]
MNWILQTRKLLRQDASYFKFYLSSAVFCNKKLHHSWTSKAVQEKFVQFFQQEDHKFIPSSSVLPWNDPSLFFVNAGMNQFKPVLLGTSQPPCKRAVNSQKCIRVGGKHNDLSAVGLDSYHHTFFEMLGSWSFGDYFKEEASRLAWQLLTEEYGLSPERLYVTYFGGDDVLGLAPDLQARNAWLRLGVPVERVLPFGMKDNFWEMGAVGPCGPCSELHYYRGADSPESVAHLVNAGHEDLIELWNLVFVQYKRRLDATLEALQHHHVDTGMGLERLTATLNNCTSNYDTDLFQPVFQALQQVSGCASYSGSFSGPCQTRDTVYRLMADHARMAVVALADGCLPTASSTELAELAVLQDWLTPVCSAVVDTLSCRYPTLQEQLPVVLSVLRFELQHYFLNTAKLRPAWSALVMSEPRLSVLEDACSTGLLEALTALLPDLHAAQGSPLPPHVAVRFTQQFGVPLEVVEELANLYDCPLHLQEYSKALEGHRRLHRLRHVSLHKLDLDNVVAQLIEKNIPETNASHVYKYSPVTEGNAVSVSSQKGSTRNYSRYNYDPVETSVVAIVHDGNVVALANGLKEKQNIGLVLKDSNFYTAAGGQVSDVGEISFDGRQETFRVSEAESVGGYTIHWGSFSSDHHSVAVGAGVRCMVDEEYRLRCSQHHTATHLLLAAIRLHTGAVTSQLSSLVTAEELKLEVGTYGPLDTDLVLDAERTVQDWVRKGGAITRCQVPLTAALADTRLTPLPGAVYPDLVTVVTTRSGEEVVSSELCCGTHLQDVAHLIDFVITSVSSSEGAGVREMYGVCGEAAAVVLNRGRLLQLELTERISKTSADSRCEDVAWARKVMEDTLPHRVRRELQEFCRGVDHPSKTSKTIDANIESTKAIISELETVNRTVSSGAIVHAVSCQHGANKKILKAAFNIFKGRSSLVLLKIRNSIRARAVVNEAGMSAGGSASTWLQPLLDSFPEGRLTTGTNPHSLANFAADDIADEAFETSKNRLLEQCRLYIDRVEGQTVAPTDVRSEA